MTAAEKIKHILRSYFNRLLNRRQDPIFIVGTGRCGSTLLVDILMTNPGIQIDQNEQYDWFLQAANDEGKKHNPVYSDIVNYDITVKKSLEQWTPYYKSKLRIMMDTKMSKTNKRFFLKSPAITFMLPELHQLYPKAKYIHLYRNGFAVARSWFKKEYFRVKEYQENFTEDAFILECAKYYNASILAINDFFEGLDEDQKFSLSYEELTEDPEAKINALLKFSGVEEKCEFDFSQVKSTNFKIDKIEENLKSELHRIMNESLKSLHYI
ncbi:sulfotransferase family protein [Winogradskyella tangerina]|uniref:sulfotransferase family protein n=1 Tax=Winogradskyella tangerina TaxID=2023240 RepID=UPI000DBEA53C|nr:sulfotransferase [Winogradskyella tangerina]